MANAPLASAATRRQPGIIGSDTARRLIVAVFTATLFLSATLLFVVEPMVGKMVLPVFGGAPAVWNTCMVFFQAVLLAGYAYAHFSTARLGTQRQALWHGAVLIVPLLVLPLAVVRGNAPPADANPLFWLLGRLLITVGVPFFVLSASAPLLQKWFAGTGHPSASDPYFLYAASNAGSLIALLGYPLVIEPLLPLTEQARIWTVGYLLLVAATGLCAFALACAAPHGGGEHTAPASAAIGARAPTLGERLWWILLSFIPSSLMLGVTTHITTDLAAVPLLWTLPLALYLLTFVLVFARRPPLSQAWLVRLLPFLLLPLVVLMQRGLPRMQWILIPIHLAFFFVAAMVCHRRLADSRPAARHLTEFYLWMSVGGVLGGLFNAIVAPLVFVGVAEYPLVMVLACLATPTVVQGTKSKSRMMDFVLPIVLGALAAGMLLVVRHMDSLNGAVGRLFVIGVPAVLCFAFKERPVRFGLGVGAILLACACLDNADRSRVLDSERNFFGVKRVLLGADGGYRILMHGGTVHGSQSNDSARRHEPLTYYYRTGPLGDVFAAFQATHAGEPVGVIGLGTGSVACYAEPGQRFTFYEIDPAVVRIARDPRFFTFLQDCRGDYDIVVGDGRLTLNAAPDRAYSMIILDAFSSDSIPTHLFTREALQLYLSKLRADGLLAFHVSNNYLDIKPVLAGLAAEAGLVCRYRSDVNVSAAERSQGKFGAEYVVMTRSAASLADLGHPDAWRPLSPRQGTAVWTDQYSNILALFKWR